ncbi:AAA family ATPase [Streptosporangium sp. LJ11]|uniref:AAA family ATPase n=1 Tax=Streptosporangium sp. LJ11 TaxID=3436927 RepID=UPI003F79A01B
MGLCFGPPGVGKTLSARQYAQRDELETMLQAWRTNSTAVRERTDLHTLLYTPTVANSPRLIDKDLVRLGEHLAVVRLQPLGGARAHPVRRRLHRRRSHRRRPPHHQRQLPARATALRSDRSHS